MIYINEMYEGMAVKGCFLCLEKKKATDKNGQEYLDLTLSDKSGAVGAKVWKVRTNPDVREFERHDIVYLTGSVDRPFNGKSQLRVDAIRRATPNDGYNEEDLYRTTEKDAEALYAGILQEIDSLESDELKELLKVFYPESGRQKEKMLKHPAAKGMHHNYIGGLLEHTESVLRIALALAAQYPTVNRDLVVAGALLHDIGKLRELDPAPFCEYTDEGGLVGHIVLGYNVVDNVIRDRIPEFPDLLRKQLLHIILSHHGTLEFGSPKVPSTPEAMMVHFADNADAKLKEAMEAMNDMDTEGNWTVYSKALERRMFNPEGNNE